MVLCCVQPGGQVIVSGQRAASLKKKIKPQFRKNLPIQRTTLVNLVSSVFSARNDPGWQHGFAS